MTDEDNAASPLAREPEPESFGQRMVRIKRERGLPIAGPGRRPLAEKYRKQIGTAERAFAGAMADVADAYLRTLDEADPETCPRHGHTLSCPEPDCTVMSAARSFDHRAAAYVFDRIMGRPTQHVEQSVSSRLVQQLSEAFVAAFLAVNEIDAPTARRTAFAERLSALSAHFGVESA